MVVGGAPFGQPAAPPEPPRLCPVCGADRLIRLVDSIPGRSGGLSALSSALSLALATGEIHTAAYADEVWLCEACLLRFNAINP